MAVLSLASTNFSQESFQLLTPEEKRRLYQGANEEQNIEVVRQLNELGMKPAVPLLSGPNIASHFMDIATKYDNILSFFKELRKSNKLLTESEFEKLSQKRWVEKYHFSRMLGCACIAKKIEELHLIHIKIPTKIMVITERDTLEVKAWDFRAEGELFEIMPKQIKIFAEKVEEVERKMTRHEIDELIQIIAATNFTDLHTGNVIIADDGIYFIDTEFKSFAGRIQWGKLGRFYELVSEEDKNYFKSKISKKMEEKPLSKGYDNYNGYNCLVELLTVFDSHSEEEKEACRLIIEKLKMKISNLEYVGAKMVGSDWVKPHDFSFSLADIL